MARYINAPRINATANARVFFRRQRLMLWRRLARLFETIDSGVRHPFDRPLDSFLNDGNWFKNKRKRKHLPLRARTATSSVLFFFFFFFLTSRSIPFKEGPDEPLLKFDGGTMGTDFKWSLEKGERVRRTTRRSRYGDGTRRIFIVPRGERQRRAAATRERKDDVNTLNF